MSDTLAIWVVYENPADHPGAFVLRPHYCEGGRSWPDPSRHFIAPTLEQIRAFVPWGLMRFDRFPWDDPCIVETWI